MSKALTLSPDRQKLLEKLRSENSRSFTPRIPEIKLANKEMDGIKPGEFFIQEYDTVAKAKTFRSIGKNPHVIILKKAATYSYYSEKLSRLVAWTSDISGYSEFDQVILFKNDGQSPFVEFKGNYPSFKAYTEKEYTTFNKVEGKTEKLLLFKTVLYVLFEQKVYRMFVSNPGVAGIADGAKTADFKKPQLLSLTHFLDTVGDLSSEGQSSMCFEAVCELGSKFISGLGTIDFWMMQFEKTDEKPDMDFVLDTYAALVRDLENLLRDDIQRMGGGAKVEADPQIEAPIKAEDLPF